MIAELSEDLGEAMVGINESEIELLMAERGSKISDRQIDADIVMMDDRHKRKDEQTR